MCAHQKVFVAVATSTSLLGSLYSEDKMEFYFKFEETLAYSQLKYVLKN